MVDMNILSVVVSGFLCGFKLVLPSLLFLSYAKIEKIFIVVDRPYFVPQTILLLTCSNSQRFLS